MFRDEIQARKGPLTLPRSYVYATQFPPLNVFGQFAMTKNVRPSYYEIDASHSPNVTAPEAPMALLEKDSG
jgi:hypothetical protein